MDLMSYLCIALMFICGGLWGWWAGVVALVVSGIISGILVELYAEYFLSREPNKNE